MDQVRPWALRDGFESIRREMAAGFDAASADRGSIRREMAAGFDAASAERSSVRAELVRLDQTQRAIVGWLVASQATLFTAICAATAVILRAL